MIGFRKIVISTQEKSPSAADISLMHIQIGMILLHTNLGYRKIT